MQYVIGIDEVGRGPLAGPVVVAAVLIPANFRPRRAGRRLRLRDSKQLTTIQRELWREYLISHPRVKYAIAMVQPKTIDEINISEAANEAACKALCKVVSALPANSHELAGVYLDGGLYLKKLRYSRKRMAEYREEVALSTRKLRVLANTIVKGDEKITAIKIASILAKVHRDRLMVRLAKQYPGYGFERHKGYGTRGHYKAIRTLGVSKVHRLTFVDKSVILDSKF